MAARESEHETGAGVGGDLAFLAACCRVALDPAGSAPGRIEPLAPGDGDAWRRALGLARAHAVLPLLHRALAVRRPDGIPHQAMDELTRAFYGHLALQTRMIEELHLVLRLLGQAGLPAMVLKGPPLGHLAYGDAALRPCEDLDVLVRKADFLAAQRVLAGAGFIPAVALSDEEAADHARAGWDRAFRRREAPCGVELCTNVVPRHFAFEIPEVELWRESTSCPCGPLPAPVPAVEPLLVLLAAHGTKHAWSRLLWVADVAGLIARLPHGPAEAGLLRLAAATGSHRMLAVALGLADRLFDLPLLSDRPGLQELIEAPQAARLAGISVARLAGVPRTAWSPARELRFHLASRERLRDRLRYVARLALAPSYADWKAVRLHGPLRRLYPAMRPARLLASALARLVRTISRRIRLLALP